MSTAPVQVGDVLAGKYRVDRVLGVGGMGVVVAAHHIQLDDKVAIKFMLPEALSNAEAVARFAREARAAVKIKSEHVARVTDVGTLTGGAPYMVMEYLDGKDLSGWLEEQGTLHIEQIVEFLLQACEALAEAHTYGIVHRDLKPSNLFVIRRPDGTFSVKVLDFGISKVLEFTQSGSAASMTSTSAMLGSPLYMSPEQMRSSKDVDARSDIWSLGVILYELLAGRSPFASDTMPELIVKVMSSSAEPIRNKRPDAPAGMDAIIQRCLEKDRNRRYQTVAELAIALSEFGNPRSKASVERISGVIRQSSMPPASPQPATTGSKVVTVPDPTGASWGKTGAVTRPRRTLIAAATLMVIAIAAIFAIVLTRRASAPTIAGAETSSAAVPVSPSIAPVLAPVAATPSAAPAVEATAVDSATPPVPGAPAVLPTEVTRPLVRPSSIKHHVAAAVSSPLSEPSAKPSSEHHNPLDIRPQ